MYVIMNESLSTADQVFHKDQIYEVSEPAAAMMQIQGLAKITDQLPYHVANFYQRLDYDSDKPALFLPFVGEFGHLIMSHIRIVHFHQAKEKIVCCRKGEEVLFPSATQFDTNWIDPVPDLQRIGTMRYDNFDWIEIIERYPNTIPIEAGGLSPAQELIAIKPELRIPFKPKLRGLKADVVIGIRNRAFAPEKNYKHWQTIAGGLQGMGLTFAVVGHRSTAFDLDGSVAFSGNLDTDAAIELMQSCKCYVGTDSGGSHLAASVGCPMIVFGYHNHIHRDLIPRMKQVNSDIEVVADGWNEPTKVIDAIGAKVRGECLKEID